MLYSIESKFANFKGGSRWQLTGKKFSLTSVYVLVLNLFTEGVQQAIFFQGSREC